MNSPNLTYPFVNQAAQRVYRYKSEFTYQIGAIGLYAKLRLRETNELIGLRKQGRSQSSLMQHTPDLVRCGFVRFSTWCLAIARNSSAARRSLKGQQCPAAGTKAL